jgi:hypothetical protein
MDDVVRAAAALARPGDTVLLAPACASMDMFRDYAERGDAFAAAGTPASRRTAGVVTTYAPSPGLEAPGEPERPRRTVRPRPRCPCCTGRRLRTTCCSVPAPCCWCSAW